jgi:hypothetical protein
MAIGHLYHDNQRYPYTETFYSYGGLSVHVALVFHIAKIYTHT